MKAWIFRLTTAIGIITILSFSHIFAQQDYTRYLNRFIGTSGHGRVSPVASVPFGMVQCGPNTHTGGSGYNFNHNQILGFSHINKSGGGCGDFLDILFTPVNPSRIEDSLTSYPKKGFPAHLNHEKEKAGAGYYALTMEKIDVEITASSRCAFHNYMYPKPDAYLAIDLSHGNKGACTIVPQDDYDKVLSSGIQIVDSCHIKGWRISSGWAPEQHVYFYAEFSQPIKNVKLFSNGNLEDHNKSIKGKDIKSILEFELKDNNELEIKVGISSVSCEGAKKNLEHELDEQDFITVKRNAKESWNEILSKIDVKSDDEEKLTLFYTSLYHVMMYPMLSSDVDGKYRGPDYGIHEAKNFDYYGSVVGLWDTFRAAIPLQILLRPDIIRDYVLTLLSHFDHFGQLPIWVLAGNETYQMIGIHSLPVITESYLKGIKGIDPERAYHAMKVSAMKDTIGYSMRYFKGLKNYKKYGYIPADLEMESTARTLEYAYDDWCIAQMAKFLNKPNDYQYFIKRSDNYKNVFDPDKKFMRGRMKDGSFRKEFDPFFSNHRRDEYCEGNAWQWTFFVPHDIDGLIELMGGKRFMYTRLNQLFDTTSIITGPNPSGDISGMIGQYAHGNEPSHHIAYLFNHLDKPKKTQYYIHKILSTQYKNSPDGIAGNEDTGQMSAWYVFSSMGFYPVNPASMKYALAAPHFPEIRINLPNDKIFTIRTENLSEQNIYSSEQFLNGKKVPLPFLEHQSIVDGGNLLFIMDRPIQKRKKQKE